MPLGDIFDVNREMEAVSHGQRFGDYNRIASVPHHLVHKTGLADAVRQRDDGFLKRRLIALQLSAEPKVVQVRER